MNDRVTLSHGSGGRQMQELIGTLFLRTFGMDLPLTDSAVLNESGTGFAFTTDSYVVDPLFFPGGNIGKLAVCGTVNDLAVSGAVPLYISAAFIIEEGFPVADLEKIARSMAEEALNAGVRIVTGDTKVVGKGKCDNMFITTSGIGLMRPGFEHLGKASGVAGGDRLIINGPLGNHAVAVLGSRNNLSFSSSVISDCASLNHMISSLLDECSDIHFMRDLTRGGLASVLNELASMRSVGIAVGELSIPVDDPVRGVCEILGFDPLQLANEGKVLIVAGEKVYTKALEIIRSHPLGKQAAVIGEVVSEHKGVVELNTSSGGRRILETPSGILLPRIC
ncbi:MAG: hydrogenase expression/formation protein HypE [Bacteroidales bacterium]